MRLKGIIVLVFMLISTAAVVWAGAQEGGSVFESLKCGMCHKPDKKAAAVSIAEIAKAYQDKDALMKLFGGGKPLIPSDKWGMMRSQITKIKALNDQQKSDLADYLLTFK